MTPTATCGDAAGAKHVNQARSGCPSPCSAVPVLPTTVTSEIRAAVPVPDYTTDIIICVRAAAF